MTKKRILALSLTAATMIVVVAWIKETHDGTSSGDSLLDFAPYLAFTSFIISLSLGLFIRLFTNNKYVITAVVVSPSFIQILIFWEEIFTQ